ncbi:DUF2835 domain-containing protein [Thalassotalea sp. LPB0316]|uniref:DUF2835 domain-containing protein n=1 Tax=Thalassotalea sp. LPB0316 TaxID=2769490 RepID=UPI001868F88D|nr:DUF2835 domain-containing protein [Thalassotalea sp. LPB0316]QOL24995.1 DUF2835 domain-containing protein [Thalassotalea sp. LPB0316]
MSQTFYFSLNMSTQDFLPYYQGRVQSLVVTTTTGIRVEFPAMRLRKYVDSLGVRGFFCLKTEHGKFVSLTRIK